LVVQRIREKNQKTSVKRKKKKRKKQKGEPFHFPPKNLFPFPEQFFRLSQKKKKTQSRQVSSAAPREVATVLSYPATRASSGTSKPNPQSREQGRETHHLSDTGLSPSLTGLSMPFP
jgi:hypothetical protein